MITPRYYYFFLNCVHSLKSILQPALLPQPFAFLFMWVYNPGVLKRHLFVILLEGCHSLFPLPACFVYSLSIITGCSCCFCCSYACIILFKYNNPQSETAPLFAGTHLVASSSRGYAVKCGHKNILSTSLPQSKSWGWGSHLVSPYLHLSRAIPRQRRWASWTSASGVLWDCLPGEESPGWVSWNVNAFNSPSLVLWGFQLFISIWN